MRARRSSSSGPTRSTVSRLSAGAPQQRLDARDQLADGERLGQIIVAAGAKPADAIVDRAERAQHQHRRAHVLLADLLDDR